MVGLFWSSGSFGPFGPVRSFGSLGPFGPVGPVTLFGSFGPFWAPRRPWNGKGHSWAQASRVPASFSRFQRSCTSYIALNPSAFAFCVHIMDTQSNVTSTAELESHWAKYSFLSTNFNSNVFVNGWRRLLVVMAQRARCCFVLLPWYETSSSGLFNDFLGGCFFFRHWLFLLCLVSSS